MKIAMLADRLEMGGLETHVVTLVNELLRRNHRVLLNTAYINPMLLNQIDDSGGLFRYVEWSPNPVWDLLEFQPDLIHSHPFTAIFRGFEIAKALGRPFFVTVHGLYDFGLDRSPLGNAVAEQVKTIVAVDRRVAELLAGCTSHPEKIRVVYNGIDLRHFMPLAGSNRAKADWELVPDWPTLVMISRMADGKEKPLGQVLKCAVEIARQLAGLNLLVVGEGAFFSQIQAQALALADNRLRIRLTGGQSDVIPFLAPADLVLACDRAAMEALASQRAVYAMSAAGFAGPVGWDNFETILFWRSGFHPVGDAELIASLAGLLQDQVRLGELARIGRQIAVEYFDIVTTTTQLERIYRS